MTRSVAELARVRAATTLVIALAWGLVPVVAAEPLHWTKVTDAAGWQPRDSQGEVVFQDMSSDFSFITRSTIQTKDTVVRDGKEYPLAKIEVSSESHPFYTGTQKIMDTAGRVEKFRQKFGSKLGKVAK